MAGAEMADAPARPHKIAHRKLIRWIAFALVAAIAAGAGFYFWRQSQLYATTDNAYVNANTVEISAQVTGPVTKLYVRDNQSVRSEDPLFDIDPRPFEVALAKAQAQLDLARQSVSQEAAGVSVAQAQLAKRRADLSNAESNEGRTQQLVERGFLSKQGCETARTQVATARAGVQAAEAAVEQARSALGRAGEQNASVQAAAAAVNQARLDLEH